MSTQRGLQMAIVNCVLRASIDSCGMTRGLLPILLVWISATQVQAHASEGGFILLLPTRVFIIGGVLSVLATVLLVFLLPQRAVQGLFRPFKLRAVALRISAEGISCLSFALLLGLIVAGFLGSHDPNGNALPLVIWTLFWVLLFVLQGLFGDLWRGLNPWSGPLALLTRAGLRPSFVFPAWTGHWIAWICFLGFAAVLLAHPAPKDPDRLSLMVSTYWAFHFIGAVLFGPVWLERAEGLSVALNCYARVAITLRETSTRAFGWPGFRVLRGPAPGTSLAVFMITLLAVGSFDGLNETFWWLAKIGVNPLAFPGRSGLVVQTLVGLLICLALLIAVFWAVIWFGLRLAGIAGRTHEMFRAQAPALLPIALGYHLAHYASAFYIEIQYVAKFFCDQTELCKVVVTAGFFNSLYTVRIIWLSQAGAVVLGHICAIALSHVISVRLMRDHRAAWLSHLPLSALMVLYTLFGLWLLATPRGI